jgi:hypothetical protein
LTPENSGPPYRSWITLPPSTTIDWARDVACLLRCEVGDQASRPVRPCRDDRRPVRRPASSSSCCEEAVVAAFAVADAAAPGAVTTGQSHGRNHDHPAVASLDHPRENGLAHRLKPRSGPCPRRAAPPHGPRDAIPCAGDRQPGPNSSPAPSSGLTRAREYQKVSAGAERTKQLWEQLTRVGQAAPQRPQRFCSYASG